MMIIAVWARGPLGFSVGEWLGIIGATLLTCVLVAVPVLWWRDRRQSSQTRTSGWRKVICATQGHNLVNIDVPPGWSWQTCRTCKQRVRSFRRD